MCHVNNFVRLLKYTKNEDNVLEDEKIFSKQNIINF